jgi:cation:H+ antiporter
VIGTGLPVWVQILVGLVMLTLGAEGLVRGAGALARRLGISPLVVGLTVVAFGTSAPEGAVSVEAALTGQSAVALGNVVGSNIFNVLVILGLSAVVAPLVVRQQLVKLDVPVMVVLSALPLVLGWDRLLSRGDGVLLLVLLVVYLAFLGWLARRSTSGRVVADVPVASRPVPVDVAMAVLGLALLVLGADLLVTGATAAALGVGVSELVVGLTLVAAGTSLPELATSVVASLRGERDLAVGNVVGSNIFNVLFVLGAGAAVGDGMPVPAGALAFDFPVMLAVAVASLPVFITGARINRLEGGVFVLYYVLYTVYIGLQAASHPAREEFGVAVLGVVVPLTIAFAAALWLRGSEPDAEEGYGDGSPSTARE